MENVLSVCQLTIFVCLVAGLVSPRLFDRITPSSIRVGRKEVFFLFGWLWMICASSGITASIPFLGTLGIFLLCLSPILFVISIVKPQSIDWFFPSNKEWSKKTAVLLTMIVFLASFALMAVGLDIESQDQQNAGVAVTLIVLIILLLVSARLFVLLMRLERRAEKRRGKLLEADQAIMAPVELSSSHETGSENNDEHLAKEKASFDVKDSAAMAGGAVGVSIYEMYASVDDHANALKALKDHCDDLQNVDNPFEWANYLMEMDARGPASVQGVCNLIVGELGEQGALDYFNELPELQEKGIRAVQFKDRNHPNDDIHFEYEDGSPAPYDAVSVKNYGPGSNFMDVVGKSESDRYCVNSELYERLENSGKLDELSQQGKEVLDGGFSHTVHAAEAEETFDSMRDAADVAEDIPIIGVAFFGVKAVKDIAALAQGKTTTHETGVDLAIGAGKFVSRGVGASAAGATGATLGTFIFPGVGTLIGGGIGALAGGMLSSKAFNWAKLKIKYGRITKALEAIHEEYWRRLIRVPWQYRSRSADALCDEFFDANETSQLLTDEQKLQQQYANETRIYRSDVRWAPPTPMGVLTRRFEAQVRTNRGAVQDCCVRSFKKLWDYCVSRCDSEDKEKSLKNAKLHFAAVVAGRGDIMPLDSPELDFHVSTYRDQIEKFPNHPFTFRSQEGEVLSSDELLKRAANECFVQPEPLDSLPKNVRASTLWMWLAISSSAVVMLYSVCAIASRLFGS